MSIPSPDEITAAHALLLRVPGFTGRTTLADVAAVMEPAALLAASMKDLLLERDVDIRDAHFMDIAALLSDLAARHGLRITTDPEPTPATGWTEPADWPIPGHAPGLYSMYSIGDGHGPAVITENGRLLIQQNDESGNDSEEWRDRTDLYKSARWPLTPVTVRTDSGPGELVGYTSVYPPALADGWEHDEVYVWGRHDIDAARKFATARATKGQRLAALYLLPEGGHA